MTDVIRDTLLTRVYDVAIETPLQLATKLSALSKNEIYLKREDMQAVHSFKIRGAYNKIVNMPEADRRKGIITASAGNHGQAVALAAAKLGIEAMVVVPEGTPHTKTDGIKAQGGRVIVYGNDYAAASQKALEINDRQHGLFVPAFNHRDIMAGQATIGLELAEQFPEMTDLVVPTGGGGLVAGIAKYLRVTAPHIRIHAAGVSGGSAAETAFNYGNDGHTQANRFADGIAVAQLGSLTWPEIKRCVADVLTAEETQVRRLIGTLSLQGHTLEGAGAVALAAATAHREQLGQYPAVVATGGNIDADVLRQCQDLVTPHPRSELTAQPEFSTI